MGMSLEEVLKATSGRLVTGARGTLRFSHLSTDSRQVQPGGLFVALKGEQQDGHTFIPQAVQRGARGVVCQSVPDLPHEGVTALAVVQVEDTRRALFALTAFRLRSHPLPTVAITGSVGKTTTKDLVGHLLARQLAVRKSEGNLNTYTGIPITIFQLQETDQVLVVEYAMSRSGEIRELTTVVPPTIGVVLNVGLAHVGFLGSIDAVGAAKRELVEGLAPNGLAVLNADDPRVRAMADAAGRHTFYGLTGDAAVRAERVRLHGITGSHFRLISPRGEAEVFLRLPGRHSVSNALAAAAVALEFGFEPADIAAGLHGFRPPPGRMNTVSGRRGANVIDDSYNASPGSMRAALEVLRLAPRGSLRVAVLGDMLELGSLAESAHEEVGLWAGQSADHVIAVGEYARKIVAAAQTAGRPPERAVAVESLEEATARIEPLLGPETVVLVKGSRGMQMEQIVAALAETSPR